MSTGGDSGRTDSGLAVLVVIAATAALTALVTITTLAAAAGGAAAVYRAQSEQARHLAEIGIAQVVAGLGSGALAVPAVGAPLRLVNGMDTATGSAGLAGVVSSPVMGWPEVTAAPAPGGGNGRGMAVVIARVIGPDGEGRGLGGGADPNVLLDVAVDAWFRNARVSAGARVLVAAAEVRRLH